MTNVTLTSIDDAAAELLYRTPRDGVLLMSVPVDRATTIGDLCDTLKFDMLFADAIPDTVTDAMVRAGIDRYFAALDLTAPYDPFLAVLEPGAAVSFGNAGVPPTERETEYVAHAWFQLAW